MKTNIEGVDTLDTRITNLKQTLEQIRSQYQELPEEMVQRIEDLST